MKRFVTLFEELGATSKTGEKIEVMARFFKQAPPADAEWAAWLLSGRRPKRPVTLDRLTRWAAEWAELPEWLVAECIDAVGDVAEALAKLTLSNATEPDDRSLASWMEDRFLPMQGMEEAGVRSTVEAAWADLDEAGRFVWNKLLTGSLRIGVSHDLVIRALSRALDLPTSVVAHRLTGDWTPSSEVVARLRDAIAESDPAAPYPFALAHPLSTPPEDLGHPEAWVAEWKYDGIRCQLIRRAGTTFLWSRGEEAIAARFPEISEAASHLPDGTVLDGEILAWRDGPLPFAELQRRIGRKEVGKRLLAEVPCVMVAFDLLESEGTDVRRQSLLERRLLLADCLAGASAERILLSQRVAGTWDELAVARVQARTNGVEGLMLKGADSAYPLGRKRGIWWKWKVEPQTVDCVLMYAQLGSGARAALFTDYTFGIWKDGALVPFAKAYSGLDQHEIKLLDAWIRANILERFGPVRTVPPVQVFELAFEGIQPSNRHKSGIAVRFPRILRWRTDKRAEDADTFDRVVALLESERP